MDVIEVSLMELDKDDLNQNFVILDNVEYLSNSSESNTDELQTFLTQFDLCEDLYIFFKEKEITVEALKYVNTRHLDQIFNGEKISSKIILEHKLGLWQNENGIYNLKPQNNSNSSDIVDAVTKQLSVKDILKQTIQGQEIIASYEGTKLLIPADRTFIVHKIIQIYLENNFIFNRKICKKIAEEIIEIFPSEVMDTYFLQQTKNISPKGKLWDRYYGRKRYLKNLSSKKTKISKTDQQYDQFEISEEMEEICTELKYIRDPSQINEKWRKTMEYRTKQAKTLSLDEIHKNWPLYTCFDNSLQLVNMDFAYLFPLKKFSYNKWEIVSSMIDSLAKGRIKDTNCAELLKQILNKRNIMDTDNYNIYIMKLLHSMLCPKTKCINGTFVKYTIADSQQAFCVEVENENQVENSCKLDPFLIVYGENFKFEKFFVVFKHLKIEFKSFLEAVQYCFKLFKIFNLNFTPQCELVWTFISQFLFEIDVSTKSPALSTFIADINSNF